MSDTTKRLRQLEAQWVSLAFLPRKAGGRIAEEVMVALPVLLDIVEAANPLLRRYVDLVDSGDCGSWETGEEPEVAALHAALARLDKTVDAT